MAYSDTKRPNESLVQLYQMHAGSDNVHGIAQFIQHYYLAIDNYNKSHDSQWITIIEHKEREMRRYLYKLGLGVIAQLNWLTKLCKDIDTIRSY